MYFSVSKKAMGGVVFSKKNTTAYSCICGLKNVITFSRDNENLRKCIITKGEMHYELSDDV